MSTKKATITNWRANLTLGFEQRKDKTVLCKNEHYGPLLVQKPFYPEGKVTCHIYLLHPPGGVVQGDRLNIDVDVSTNAHALITTPAASKFYRSTGKLSTLKQTINLKDNSKIEWLPQETLLFDNSQVELTTIIHLQGDARFIGWEMLCLGRTASKQKFVAGSCRQYFEIWRDNIPEFIERSHIQGGTPVHTEKWGLAALPLTATMVATHAKRKQLLAIQSYIESIDSDDLLSVTLKKELLICRFLGRQAEVARKHFTHIWQLIRPQIMGKKAMEPRIWNT